MYALMLLFRRYFPLTLLFPWMFKIDLFIRMSLATFIFSFEWMFECLNMSHVMADRDCKFQRSLTAVCPCPSAS